METLFSHFKETSPFPGSKCQSSSGLQRNCGHSAMTTFSEVINMPALAARRIVIKIQNERLLPTVKRLANDSTMLSF